MSDEQTVTFYLHPKLRRQARAGKHNFISRMGRVLADAGMTIAFDDDSQIARLRARKRPGYGLFLMQEPVNDRSLTFRRTYIYPFWHIEKQAKRWLWPVAQLSFDASTVDPRPARNFQRFWRKRLFPEIGRSARMGFVYVPLQGQLLTRRSFQECSPIQMLEAVLKHETRRDVVVTLHPNEFYPLEEKEALDALIASDSRLSLQESGDTALLRDCDYIVTQNSGVGFQGFFFDKPLILFAETDFHHIALNVSKTGVAEAFAAVPDYSPDCAAYLYWFLQEQAINAGRDRCQETIQSVFQYHGWPV